MSITATFTDAGWCAVLVVAAPIRRMPGGAESPERSGSLPTAWTVWSRLTNATAGSDCTFFSCPGESVAAKPLIAWL